MSDDYSKKVKLSRKVIESITPKDKVYYVTDTDVTGLRVLVRPTGTLTYVFDYRMGKGRAYKPQRVTIGSTQKFTPEQAREKAKALMAQVIGGIDPASDERQRKDKHTFAEIWERYIEEHVKIKNKPRTLASVQYRGERVIVPYFKNIFVEDITAKDIHQFMLSRKDIGPTDANRSRASLSKIFSLCERPWEIRPLNSNPCRGVFKFKEQRRERYLSDDELKRLMKVLDTMISENMANCEDKTRERSLHRVRAACYFKLMIFTGARGAEWREAKIAEVDLERMILRPESTKNDEPAISLPPEAIQIVEFLLSLPRPEDNPYLFPGKYGLPDRYRENMGTPSLIWKEVLKQAKIKDIKPHDLRHSWAAFALASGLSLADVGQQLNHKTYQTTKRYEHLANEVKQRNVAKVSEAIQSMSSGSAKIVDIRDAKNNAK